MNDFQKALGKWDRIAEGYKAQIENQRQSINRLLEQNMFLEGIYLALVLVAVFAPNRANKGDQS